MVMRTAIWLLFISSFLLNSCCKEPIPPNNTPDPFLSFAERNNLPHTLPTTFNVATPEQTKEIFLYGESTADIVFRAIGVKDTSTDNTKLWIQILNPAIRAFADTQIDSFYVDTILGPPPLIEVHNRSNGMNFYELDTALLALPFLPSQFDSWRPRLLDNTVVTVHVRFNEFFTASNTRYDVERGVLKRKNQDYLGLKNIVTGDVFFIELEDRYTIKSIVVRKD